MDVIEELVAERVRSVLAKNALHLPARDVVGRRWWISFRPATEGANVKGSKRARHLSLL
jgi:hypothetical protein